LINAIIQISLLNNQVSMPQNPSAERRNKLECLPSASYFMVIKYLQVMLGASLRMEHKKAHALLENISLSQKYFLGETL